MREIKFAIAIENTPSSLDFLKKFLDKFKFYKSYKLDVIVVEEFEEQEKEIKDLKKKIENILSKENIKFNFIKERGDPVGRVLYQIDKNSNNVFVCAYEHSILGTTFFENIMREIEMPVIVIK